jgi:hypothetical protein
MDRGPGKAVLGVFRAQGPRTARRLRPRKGRTEVPQFGTQAKRGPWAVTHLHGKGSLLVGGVGGTGADRLLGVLGEVVHAVSACFESVQFSSLGFGLDLPHVNYVKSG